MFKKLSFILVFILTFGLKAQDSKSVNLPKFYKKPMHFGFAIGFNETDFRLHPIKNTKFPDTLKSVYSSAGPGFNLGIITDFRLHEYVRLRFIPSLSFASRKLDYDFVGYDTTIKGFAPYTKTKEVESTFIFFPVLIKVQTKRLNNFGAYVIGGGAYSIDLASQKNDQANTPNAATVKLIKNDVYLEAGAGVDFYLTYFKLALEAKLSVGTRNLVVRDNQVYSSVIDKLNSHIFSFHITFEG